MTLWHALGLVVCIGLSFGVNELTRARFDYAMGPAERVEVAGSLKVQVDGASHQFDLASIQVIAGAAQRMWGSPLPVRALWLRSAELEAQSEPDLELFVDLATVQPAIDANLRSVDAFKGRELPVMPVAVGSGLRSRIRLPGAANHSVITAGTVAIRQSTVLPSVQGAASFRVTGELSAVLKDGATVRQLSGSFETTLLWY